MKTLLLHVDDDAGNVARLRAAVALADRYGAHIVASHPIPMLGLYAGNSMYGYSDDLLLSLSVIEEEKTSKLKQEFEQSLPSSPPSWEWIQEKGDPTEVLSMQARTADLTIIGLSPESEGLIGSHSLAGDVALHSKLPVLAVPKNWEYSPKKTIMVAWNSSLEASKAVHFALPLLKQTEQVVIVEIGEEKSRQFPAADMATYLSRHGLKVETIKLASDKTVGATLLSAAKNHNAEMIVMGAFGHMRLREAIFGGVSQELLCNEEMPLFMCH